MFDDAIVRPGCESPQQHHYLRYQNTQNQTALINKNY